jgi:hypothetical protein
MSLINRKSQTLIAPCCAALLLDLDESTLRKGLAGTESLTQVRRGNGKRQRVSFILEEIIRLKTEWIEAAQRKSLKHRQSSLVLVS